MTIKKTIKLTDAHGRIAAPDNPAIFEPAALNGLHPLGLNSNVGVLGRSFDPEGLAIGSCVGEGYVIIAGNGNDHSVTQTGSGQQFDVYVDFMGGSVQRDLDQPTRLNGVEVGAPPAGYSLIPGVLHSYRLDTSDLPGYVPPGG